MKEKLNGFFGSVKELWGKATKTMRVLFLSVLAGVLLLALVITLALNRNDYVLLYDGMSVTESAEVMVQLQDMGVEGRMENGAILVPESEETNVRMQLAMRGYADSSGLGYEVFGMGSGLTATQFEKNQYEIYQLQERLQSTIKTFPEIKDAIVTISIPENSMFVLQDEIVKPSVSVKIEKHTGRELTTDQVYGILNLIKNAIPGLEEENISIVDETGDLLLQLESGGDKHNTKLALTEQVNESFRRKILSLLQPVYGSGVVAVVNTVLDTDENITDIITYNPIDPENPTNNPLDYAQYDYERNGGTALAQGVPGANDNTDVPQYAGQNQDDGTGDYYRSSQVLDYLVSSERNQIIREGLVITDMTVSVLIDAETLPNADRDKIIDLVAGASGLTADKISVQSLKFNDAASISGANGIGGGDGGLSLPMILAIVFGGLALLIIIVMIILTVLRKRKEKLAAAGAYEEGLSLVDMMEVQEEPEFEPIQLMETQEQKLKAQIRDLADSDPEIVAQLIKTWLIN